MSATIVSASTTAWVTYSKIDHRGHWSSDMVEVTLDHGRSQGLDDRETARRAIAIRAGVDPQDVWVHTLIHVREADDQ